MTYAYCDNCAAVRPVVQHPMVNPNMSGEYLGGDIVCSVCAWIVATMYVENGSVTR